MNIFHEAWVAAGPYIVFCAVVLSPVVLGFIWICVRDCLLLSHRFESEWSTVDVLSYRVRRGKLIVHYRVTNRSDGPCGFGANQLRAFQHGIAIGQSGPEDDDLRGWERNVTLLPGASVTLNQMFLLRDKSPVTVVANYCEDSDVGPLVLPVSNVKADK